MSWGPFPLPKAWAWMLDLLGKKRVHAGLRDLGGALGTERYPTPPPTKLLRPPFGAFFRLVTAPTGLLPSALGGKEGTLRPCRESPRRNFRPFRPPTKGRPRVFQTGLWEPNVPCQWDSLSHRFHLPSPPPLPHNWASSPTSSDCSTGLRKEVRC